MGLNRIRLGDYITRSTTNNRDLQYGMDLITGVTSEGIFSNPKGDPIEVDLKPYKIVNNGAFVYNPTRIDLGSIAYRTEGLCIVSHLYIIFYLNEKGKKIIDPIWLYLYFRRDEFRREVRFRNFGSQRPEFSFNDMSDIEIPLPDIMIQRKYVAIYKAMVANQQSYERGLEDMELSCEAYMDSLMHQAKQEPIGKYIEIVETINDEIPDIIQIIAWESKATKICIATGYMFDSGLNMIRRACSTVVNNGGSVELLVGSLQTYKPGVKQKNVNRNTADIINVLCKSPYFTIMTYPDNFYHGKYYYISNGETTYIITGSSNVTSTAYRTNKELDVIFCFDRRDDPLLREFENWYAEIKEKVSQFPTWI